MARPGSAPIADTIPPPPSNATTEDRIAWLERTARATWKRLDVTTIDVHDLAARMGEVEESLGQEGSAAKGRQATGLHLAFDRVEKRQEEGFDAMGTRLDKIETTLLALSEAKKTRTDWTTWAARVVLGVVLVAGAGGAIAIVVSGARVQLAPSAGAAAPPR